MIHQERKAAIGKVVVVTGAGRGFFGRAIALRFGLEGAKVVVNDVNLAEAEAVSQEIVTNGGTALAITADVADKNSGGCYVHPTDCPLWHRRCIGQ